MSLAVILWGASLLVAVIGFAIYGHDDSNRDRRYYRELAKRRREEEKRKKTDSEPKQAEL